MKNLYVWFEVNSTSMIQGFLDNCEYWDHIGDLIVTSKENCIYEVIEDIHSMQIYPIFGIKISDIISSTNIYDSTAWGQVSAIAEDISIETRGKPVILEAEGMIAEIISSGITVDTSALFTAMTQSWPDIWWWPPVSGYSDTEIGTRYDITRTAIKAIQNIRLIEHLSSGYVSSRSDDQSIANLESTIKLCKNPLSIVYLDNISSNQWDLKSAKSAIEIAYSNDVILYPGFSDLENANKVKIK